MQPSPQSVLGRFHHHTQKPLPASGPSRPPQPSQLWATTDPLPSSLDLPALHISCKQNRAAYGLLRLASFTQHNAFKIRLCRRVHRYIILSVVK